MKQLLGPTPTPNPKILPQFFENCWIYMFRQTSHVFRMCSHSCKQSNAEGCDIFWFLVLFFVRISFLLLWKSWKEWHQTVYEIVPCTFSAMLPLLVSAVLKQVKLKLASLGVMCSCLQNERWTPVQYHKSLLSANRIWTI